MELELNNGIFEYKIDEKPYQKGNYTITGEIIIFTYTHMFGDWIGLKSNYYTISELNEMTWFFDTFPSQSINFFSINDNILDLRSEYETRKYIRK